MKCKPPFGRQSASLAQSILDGIYPNSTLSQNTMMKNFKTIFTSIFLFVGLLFTGLPAGAQTRTLSGKITDFTGSPLAGASVSLKGGNATKTNDQGNFSFQNVSTSTVTLVVTYVGYLDKQLAVSAGDGPITIVLEAKEKIEDEVVVTGMFDKRKKMEASVAISTVSAKEIAKLVPVSAADLLKNVPGIFVNTSLGEIRNIVYSRGVSAGSNEAATGYYYVSMQEDGLPVTGATYSNYGPDYFLRADATVGRVEAVRGGTASILGANAPGGIFNYVMKEGGNKTEGEVRTRYGLEGDGRNHFYRADINIGGPLGKNWFWDAGGFYRYDEGHRYPGFPMNNGGQFRANLVKKYNTGSFKVYGKYLNDHNAWSQFLPTVDFQNPKVLSGFHNYSPIMAPSVQQDIQVNQTGRFERYKTEDKAHNLDKSIGSTWEQRLGSGWTLNNAFRFSEKSTHWNAGAHLNYFSMTDLISYALLGTLGQPGSYSFRNLRTGSELLKVNSFSGFDFNVVSGATPGSNWAPNSFLWFPMIYNSQQANEFLDQFSLTKKLKNMSFTVGGFYSHFKVDRLSGAAGSALGTIEEHPELITITRTNPDNSVTHITNSNGFYGVGGGQSQNEATQNQAALFFGHNWQITPALNLDWGVRYERVNVKGQNSPGVTTQSTTGGLDGNPLTLYDNNIGSTPQSFGYDKSLTTFSYSAGVNYKISNTFAVYGRVSNGRKAPDLDMYFSATSDFLAKALNPIAQEVMQVEGGVKTKTGNLNLFVTPFYSVLSNVPTVQLFNNADQTNYFTPTIYNKFRTLGVELEGDYSFAKHFNVRTVLTLQKGTAVDFSSWLSKNPGPADDSLISYSGTEQDNLPRAIVNITPSYNTNRFFTQLTWSYMGKRQANVANAFQLPSFSQFNFSAGFDVSKHVNVGVVVNNLFNTYGIMSWAPPGTSIQSLDRQGFTEEMYKQNKNNVYGSVGIPPRAYFLTGTFKF